MSNTRKCKFYEWDETTFITPNEYILDENNDLADALNVFYSAGGYEFFCGVALSIMQAIGWIS